MKRTSRRIQQRYLLRMLALGFMALGIVACQKQIAPEESCNFVQNSSEQRVSWGSRTLDFYVHDSVPSEYYVAIRNAADTWNGVMGREVIRIEIEGVAGDINSRRDNVSMIYLLQNWDNDNLREQARTSVRWRGTQIIESDILLNDQYFNFSVEPRTPMFYVDLESLMVHEMGHALGLAHVEEDESVMHPQLARGEERRLVSDLDVESLSCEYPTL